MYLRHECCAVCLQDLNTSVRVTPPRSVRHHEFRELWKQTPVSEFSALENIRYFCIVSERTMQRKSGCVAVSKAATKYYGIFARFCAKLVAKFVLSLQLPYSFYQNLSTTWMKLHQLWRGLCTETYGIWHRKLQECEKQSPNAICFDWVSLSETTTFRDGKSLLYSQCVKARMGSKYGFIFENYMLKTWSVFVTLQEINK